MGSADLYAWLVETTFATSAAMLAVLLLRKPLRNAFGAHASHAAWSVVPAALLATLLPAAEAGAPVLPLTAIHMPLRLLAAEAPRSAPLDIAVFICIAWLCGCVVFAVFLAWQQVRFVHALGDITDHGDGLLLAEAVAGLPAVVGVWQPRIVMPADAMSRYDATERGLMLAHERAHIARGDVLANALVSVWRCIFWFNPLLHLAARRFRDDQELACDERVIAAHPQSRRAYGEAMLKTQVATTMLPLGCHWGQSHPLKERIEMLRRPAPSVLRRMSGRGILVVLLLVAGYAAWAAQPPRMAMQATVGKQDASDFKAVFEIEGDGVAPGLFLVNKKFDEKFSMSNQQDGRTVDVGAVVAEDGADNYRLSMDVAVDGKSIGHPVLVMRRGDPAELTLSDASGNSSLRLKVTVDHFDPDNPFLPPNYKLDPALGAEEKRLEQGDWTAGKRITMQLQRENLRQVITEFAKDQGMTVDGLELIKVDQRISASFQSVPPEVVVAVFGEKADLDARLQGSRIQFSKR